MDIPNKEGAQVSYEIWNSVLALSMMLDGYHPKQIIYLNLVCWIDLEHLGDLALSSFWTACFKKHLSMVIS